MDISVSQTARFSTRVLIAFGCVYFFWGSTYVAMRYGVQVLSPWIIGSARYLIAGTLMLGLCAARGMRLRQSRRDFAMLAAIGVLMLGVGNTGVLWAEQYLPSGLAALLAAVIPLYVASIETILPHGERLRGRGWAGIAIGLLGLLILLLPGWREGMAGHRGQMIGSLVALAAALAWSCASLLSRRARLATPLLLAAAWEMIFAGVFCLIPLAMSGDAHRVHWTRQAVLAIGWLVVFGSLVGYTAYIYLLEHVPVAKVSTYAYINPVVAVVLGALFLGERLVPVEYVGMVAILAAVYLVTSSQMQSGAAAAELACVETEPLG